MSNRSNSSQHRQGYNSNSNSNSNSQSQSQRAFRGKSQKQHFIPRSNPKLSSSLRHHSTSTSNSNSNSNSNSWEGIKKVEMGGGGGSFVKYLPQDEAVAIGLGVEEGGLEPLHSQTVVDLLNAELAKFLKFKPRLFWHQVAVDTSLHEFLDCFLQFRSRWYDFPYHGPKAIVAGVIVGDLELSRRVFMLLYRISSNKDPGSTAAMSLSQKDHQVLLQEKKLLDLPKLLDICAIYGHENEDLTRLLTTIVNGQQDKRILDRCVVWNAVNAQPDIHGRFTPMLSHFLGLVHTMYARCTSKLEALISTGGGVDNGPPQRHVEYLEVMDFINDAVVSMSSFVSAYRPAAVYFSCPIDSSHGNEELANVLATLHDSLLPVLQQGLEIILTAESNFSMLTNVSVSLRILSSRLVYLGWKLLDNCYLSEELFKDNFPFPAAMKMFPASVEDPVIRADILVQTFKEIAAFPQHAQGKHHRGTFLQNIERNYQILHKIESLKLSGWIFMDDEQYQYLAGMMIHPLPAVSRKLTDAPNSSRGDNLQTEEDAAIAESKISQVKDLFPDYGKGFILACLEVYDNNQEEVIQRILEGTLHEDLKRLDISIETVPPKSSPLMNKKDKGKGILVESTELPSTNLISQKPKLEPVSSLGPSVSSSVGRFVRKSKDNQLDHDTIGLRDAKNVEKTAALVSQYEYEDEYDDSFDDLGMTIVESGVEETEILGERLHLKSSVSSCAETQGSGSSTGASKWNSKKKPQFYVKDGKNYSYKVEGSIAVADQKQASLVNQVQKELIHGLGRGGNRPLGAVKILEEQNEAEMAESEPSEADGDGGRGRGRGRGRRGGGRHNHYRKDRALKKHMTGLGGF